MLVWIDSRAAPDRSRRRRRCPDDALGHRRATFQGEGVADRHDLVADGDIARGERGRDDAGRVVELQDGDVVGQRSAEDPAERCSPLTVTVTSPASATTWALVRMWPSVSRTMPGAGAFGIAGEGSLQPTCMLVEIDTVDGWTATTTPATSMNPVPAGVMSDTGTAAAGDAVAGVVIRRVAGDEACPGTGGSGHEGQPRRHQPMRAPAALVGRAVRRSRPRAGGEPGRCLGRVVRAGATRSSCWGGSNGSNMSSSVPGAGESTARPPHNFFGRFGAIRDA